MIVDFEQRVQEIASFLGRPEPEVRDRLSQGFIYNHHKVADSFNEMKPKTDDELLEWYRTTDAYIWELSAYHLDPGFNYSGMADGIATHLVKADKDSVLCLGDGIGDLTLACRDQGLDSVYHDLAGSLTAEFALTRLGGGGLLTSGWTPEFPPDSFDAVVALDFFEHLVNVEEWVEAVHVTLNSGGLFLAQNAFAIGDEDHGGSIPMHLTVNNRFEKDWDPLLESLGFTHEPGGWWRK